VTLEHIYYQNHEKRSVTSTHDHLASLAVVDGEVVERGQIVGSPEAGGSVEGSLRLRSGSEDLPAERFLGDHRDLFVPQDEAVLVLVDVDDRRLRLFEQGELVEEVDIAIGQREGRKREEGDLRTPRGMYFVVDRYRGEIGGAYGAWYGGHWLKINYPNRFDAEWGLSEGIVTGPQERDISRAWTRRELTDQSTDLGSGIGFHGWAEEWEPETHGTLLSWGCVVLHLRDVSRLYDRIPLGTMVILR